MTTASESALLATQAVSYRVQASELLRDISLQLRRGERTMIMGANGAGKSLLLRVLHGLIPPASGHILWQGKPFGREARLAQAMVFQRPVMLRRSVAANLRFALAVRGLRGVELKQRVEQALQRGRLEKLARQPARLLSGGEQQRLALVRALSCSPTLLLLDEPTASLDPASTAAIETLLHEAHAEGVTIVMVTHDKGQAARLGDRVVFMHAGAIVESGAAEQVLQTPVSAAATAWLDGRLYI